jgi:hypothetical protein
MRNATRSGILVALVLVLVGAGIVGCTQWGLLPNNEQQVDKQIESTIPNQDVSRAVPAVNQSVATACGLSTLTGDDRTAAIQEALDNPKVQNIQQELASRGYNINQNDALAFSIDGEKLVWLPARLGTGIVYETYLGSASAVGAIQDGKKVTNIRADRGVRHMMTFDPKTQDKIFKQARKNKQLKTFEKVLKGQNQRIDWSQSVLFIDMDNGTTTIGLAIRETNSAKPAWFGYRINAELKGHKLDVQKISADSCKATSSTNKHASLEPMSEFSQIRIAVPSLYEIGEGGTVTSGGGTTCYSGSSTACWGTSAAMWRIEYDAKWSSGSIINDFLTGYNTSLQNSNNFAGAIGYSPSFRNNQPIGSVTEYDPTENPCFLLLGGFENLSRNEFDGLAQSIDNGSSCALFHTVKLPYVSVDKSSALTILQGLGSTTISQWLVTLANAIIAGNFDTTYDALLQNSQFLNFRQAILYSLQQSSSTLDQAKWIIQRFAVIVSGSNQMQLAAQDITRVPEFIVILANHTDKLKDIYTAFYTAKPETGKTPQASVAAAIGRFETALTAAQNRIQALGGTTGIPLLGQSSPIDKTRMHDLVSSIISKIHEQWKGGGTYSTDFATSLINQIVDVLNFLGETTIDLRRAREIIASVLGVKTFMEFTGPNSVFGDFQLVAFSNQGATFRAVIPGYNSNSAVKVVLRWNDCASCFNDKDNIISQLGTLVKELEGTGGIIGYMFTQPGATAQIEEILVAARNSTTGFAWRDVAIIFVWWEGNQLKYECIGLRCSQLSEQQKRAQACMQAGLSPLNCNVKANIPSIPVSVDGATTITHAPAWPTDEMGNVCTPASARAGGC